MMKTVTPLLSICIPTLNRAGLLKVLLDNLLPALDDCRDRVEIVVSDNASSDETHEVVQRSGLPIVYGRLPNKVGFARSVLNAVGSLASGEFIWIVGDDDIVLPGALPRVLSAIKTNPTLDYHYLNFGWIDHTLRSDVVRTMGRRIPAHYVQKKQFLHPVSQRLERIEDLVFLPCDNPAVIFNGVFCFVVRRQLFVEGSEQLQTSDVSDGSSVLIADCFPHAMLTVPKLAGRPVSYVAEPCLLQSVNGWEWGDYFCKQMIFGTFQFFEWLQTTEFAGDAMQFLWDSYPRMSGQLFRLMLCEVGKHKGMDIVLAQAIPRAAGSMEFWKAFLKEDDRFDTTRNRALTPE